jgi:hypothetical protein
VVELESARGIVGLAESLGIKQTSLGTLRLVSLCKEEVLSFPRLHPFPIRNQILSRRMTIG